MNELQAVITSLQTEGQISLVVAEAAGIAFHTLVIDTSDTASYLREGNTVTLVWKESAVSIAKQVSGYLSIRNKIPCVVTHMETGSVLSTVSLDYNGQTMVSVITTKAIQDLHLQVGDHVEALIKTTDISLLQPNP